MAIDTAAKRSQVLSLSLTAGLGLFGILPIPDGTVAQADRQHLAGMYGGILAAASQVFTGGHPEAQDFAVGGPVAGSYHSGGAAKAGYSTGGAVAGQMAPLGGS